MSRTSRLQVLLGSLFLGGVVIIGAQGCTVTSGDPNTSFSDGGFGNQDTGTPLPDSGVVPGNPACNSCLFAQCSGQHAVCESDADCTAIYKCAVADPSRARECFDAYPNGQAAYTALYQCDNYYICNGCTSECSAIADFCPAPGEDSGTEPPLDCNGCIDQNCSAEKTACTPDDSSCQQLSICTATCDDPDTVVECIGVCEETFPEGVTQRDALANCTRNNCSTACNL